MTGVIFSSGVGGDGSAFNDGTGAGGMAEGGHRTNFFPLLIQYLAVAAFVVDRAQAAADAAASAMNAPGTSATTTSTIVISAIPKSFTLVEAGKLFSVGQRAVVASAADATRSVLGPITAFNSATRAMTINVDTISGSGSFSDGVVSLSASGGVPPTRTLSVAGLLTGGGDLSANRAFAVPSIDGTDVRLGRDNTKAMTSGFYYAARDEVNLVFGATITTAGDAGLDFSKFITARVIMGGNAFLPNPLVIGFAIPRREYRIALVQDSVGSRLLSTWGNAYRAVGGKPVLSTAPGAVDYLYLDLTSYNSSLGTFGDIVCRFVKAPTN